MAYQPLRVIPCKILFCARARAHTHTHTHARIYLEIVECGESDKMIKTSGKMDKSDIYKGFSSTIYIYIYIYIYMCVCMCEKETCN